MGIEENKKVLQRYFDEVMNGRDYTNIDELMHDDFNGKPGNESISGKESHKQYSKWWYSVFPDGRNELKEMIAEGDKVVAYSVNTGTHTGADFFGQPASGKKFEFGIMAIYTFKDGKLISGRVIPDQLSAFQQLGFYPPLPED
jgi:predicted ester cyclase